MYVVTKSLGESLFIDLAGGVDPSTPVGDVLADPIEIGVTDVDENGTVRLTVDAPDGLCITDSELVEGEGLILGL